MVCTAVAVATAAPIPAAGQLALEPLFTVGESEGVAFGRIGDAAFAPDGRLYVLDEQAKQVLVFGPQGRPAGRLGREGQGPGEIGGARELEVGPEGRVAVLDYRNVRLSLWSANGTFLESHPLRELVAGAAFPQELFWRGGQMVIKATDFGARFGTLIALVDARGWRQERVLASVDSTLSCDFCAWAFGPAGAVLARGDTLYTLDRIDLNGERQGTVRRTGLAAAPRSVEERERLDRQIGARRGAEARAAGGSASGASQGVSPWRPRLPPGSLEVDGSGLLWAAPTRPDGKPGLVDVFTPAGGLLATLSFPHPVRGVRVLGDRAALLSEDALGAPQLRVYRIRR